jgi:putative zinc finger/helix-turn-helix YgiT family protein
MNKQVLCENCKEIRGLKMLDDRPFDYYVKDEAFTILGKFAICDTCNNEVSNIEIERYNQRLAFDRYRAKHKLVTVDEIIENRKKYNLKQKDYSLLLGFGEIQITRYERGTLPSPAHSTMIKESQNPTFMLQCVKDNGHKIDPAICENLLNELQDTQEAEIEIIEPIRNMMAQAPNLQNGFQRYNWHKLKQLVSFFAKEQVPHFTSMCKLLFFTDFYHFREFGTSISGSRYVRMQYGPCPERHQTIFESIPGIVIEPSPTTESGRVLRLVEDIEFNFTQQEWATIIFVNEKFKNKRSKDLSDFSHEERAWLEHENNQVIPYEYAQYINPQREI